MGGTSRTDPSYKLPDDLAPALKAGFEIAPNDPPEIVTLPNDKGYAMVSPAQVVPAAPAPLASIRDKVASDWIDSKALARARAVAMQVAAKVQHGTPLAQAMTEAGAQPAVRPLKARRIQIATAQGPVPAPLRMLFVLGQGASRMIPDPEGRGFYIVKVEKITPGNALLNPSLIGQMQAQLQTEMSDDYAQEFLAAIRQELKSKRNETAIQAEKTRMANSAG